MMAVSTQIFVFIGPPGAGKGTQAKLISKELNMRHLSSGDLLRSEIEAESDIGQAAAGYVERGELVPDQIIADMILGQLKDSQKVVLDGFPRNLDQAKLLDGTLQKEDLSIDRAVFFDTDFETLRTRISHRLVCERHGCEYNLLTKPPKQAGVCDNCGGKLVARTDDDDATFKTRYETYLEQTLPAIRYYKDLDVLVEIDASAPANEIYDELKSAVCEVAL